MAGDGRACVACLLARMPSVGCQRLVRTVRRVPVRQVLCAALGRAWQSNYTVHRYIYHVCGLRGIHTCSITWLPT